MWKPHFRCFRQVLALLIFGVLFYILNYDFYCSKSYKTCIFGFRFLKLPSIYSDSVLWVSVGQNIFSDLIIVLSLSLGSLVSFNYWRSRFSLPFFPVRVWLWNNKAHTMHPHRHPRSLIPYALMWLWCLWWRHDARHSSGHMAMMSAMTAVHESEDHCHTVSWNDEHEKMQMSWEVCMNAVRTHNLSVVITHSCTDCS